ADLACLDKDGDLLWYRSLVGDYPALSNQVGMASSPILWKDLVIVPMQNVGESFLAGIDKMTGENRWKTPRPRAINWITPLLRESNGQAEVIFQGDDELTAYNAATGKERWSFKDRLHPIISPTLAGDRILASGGSETFCLTPAATKAEAKPV